MSINCSSVENPAIIYTLLSHLKLVELTFSVEHKKWTMFTGDFKLQKSLFLQPMLTFFVCFKEGYKYELFNNEHHKSGSCTHSYETICSCKDVTNSLELTGMGFWFYTINFSLYWLQNIYTSNEYILRAKKTLTFCFLHPLFLSLKPTIPQLTSHQPLCIDYYVLLCSYFW